MSDLLKLAARCEAATGPDRDLDYDIQTKALGKAPNLYGFQLDPFTRSIDAAMTLVPEGHWFVIGRDSADWARCYDIERVYDAPEEYGQPINAATHALALCAAALRARSEAAAVGGR